MEERAYSIDGYPVSRQEVLDQATMICGQTVYSLASAKHILKDDGREVTKNEQTSRER